MATQRRLEPCARSWLGNGGAPDETRSKVQHVKKRFSDSQLLSVTPATHFITTFTLLFPSIFVGFQNHHDGYVLETAKLFRESLEHNSDYPFSQYGPLWSAILGTSTYLFPEPLVLIGIRFISILCYATAMYFASKIFLLLTEKVFPLTPSFILVGTWYFFGPYHGWPSTFILPLVLLLSYLLCESIYLVGPVKRNLFFVGMIVGTIQFGRAQIGIALLACVLFIGILFLGFKNTVLTLIGYAVAVFGFILFLSSFGMLENATYDQIYFGFKFHLSSDRGATRIPYWTLGIAILTILLGRLIIQTKDNSRKSVQIIIWGLTNSVLGALILEILTHSELLSLVHWKFLQRAFVGIVLGLAIFCSYESLRDLVGFKKLHSEKSLLYRRARFGLGLISLSVLTQIYPLFSSHHVWYSLIPVLLTSYLLLDSRGFLNLKQSYKYVGIQLLLFLIYFTLWQYSNISSSSQPPIKELVLTENEETNSLRKLLISSNKYIPRNSTVQNFCQDPTIFIVRDDLIPASRIFVWWEKFSQFKEYRIAARNPADYALVCDEQYAVIFGVVNPNDWKLIFRSTDEMKIRIYESIKSK